MSTKKAPSEIELSPGEVIIKVEAFGINRLDVFQRQGFYPPPGHVTDIPGLEVSGTIVSGNFSFDCGLGLCVGDKVCALVAGGGYAEYVVAPITQCLPLPKGLTFEEAAALPEACFTIWQNLFDISKCWYHGAKSSLLNSDGYMFWASCFYYCWN